MAQRTPLKWPGSKCRAMSELKKHLPAGKRLVEPFAGSCAVMMNTDYDEYLIADINPDLINFYQQLICDTDAVVAIWRAGCLLCADDAEYFYLFGVIVQLRM